MDEEEGLKGEVDAVFHNSFLSRHRIINHLCMYLIPPSPSLLPSFKWLLFNLSQLRARADRGRRPSPSARPRSVPRASARLKGAIYGRTPYDFSR